MDRFSEYRIMWVLVLFDLPTETKKDKSSNSPFMSAIVPAAKMQMSISGG